VMGYWCSVKAELMGNLEAYGEYSYPSNHL
jgi:hypothetical protein